MYRKTPKNSDTQIFAVITLKFGHGCFTIESCVQKMQTEWQSLDADQQSDLGLHCLPRPLRASEQRLRSAVPSLGS